MYEEWNERVFLQAVDRGAIPSDCGEEIYDYADRLRRRSQSQFLKPVHISQAVEIYRLQHDAPHEAGNMIRLDLLTGVSVEAEPGASYRLHAVTPLTTILDALIGAMDSGEAVSVGRSYAIVKNTHYTERDGFFTVTLCLEAIVWPA